MKGKSLVFRCLALVLCSLSLKSAPIQWELISPYPTVESFKSVAFGAGVFVAVGTGNAVFYSEDNGVNWKGATGVPPAPGSPVSLGYTLFSVQFANNTFVAVGNSGKSYTSADGKTWVGHDLPGDFRTMTVGNGLFAAGSYSGVIATSTDGAAWRTYNVGQGGLELSIYANGKFLFKEWTVYPPQPPVYTQPLETFISSPDGVQWTRYNAVILPVCNDYRFCNFPLDFLGLSYLNGTYYAVAKSTGSWKSLKSVDGITWTADAGPISSGMNVLHVVNNQSLLLGYSNGENPTFQSTTDFVAWNQHSVPPGIFTGTSAAFGNSTYVIVGENSLVLRGQDLNNLKRDSAERELPVASVAAKDNVLVAVTSQGGGGRQILVSTNAGRNFSRVSITPGTSSFASVRYANGTFMAAGSSGNSVAALASSPDGVVWNVGPVATGMYLTDVAYASGQWIGVGLGGTIVVAPNGAPPIKRTSGTDIDLFGVAAGNGRIVAVGDSGAILTSTDGESWALQGTDEGTAVRAIVFAEGKFLAVGDNGRVYSSADGLSWSMQRIIGGGKLARLAYAHGMYVAIEADFKVGNYSTKFYSSPDAVTWTSSNVAGPTLLGADAADGKLYISGWGTTIYREKPPELMMAGRVANNHFVLDVTLPAPGNYRLLSAPSLGTTSWDQVGVYSNANNQVTWEDPNPLSASRFFLVEKLAP